MNIFQKIKLHTQRYSAWVKYNEDQEKFRSESKASEEINLLCSILLGEKIVSADSSDATTKAYAQAFNDGVDTCVEELLERGDGELRKFSIRL